MIQLKHPFLIEQILELRETGQWSNKKKCQVAMKIVAFSGFKIGAEGIHSADERIVKRIKTFRTLVNRMDLEAAFLGMSNFFLTKKDPLLVRVMKCIPHVWNKEQQSEGLSAIIWKKERRHISAKRLLVVVK
ncbi:hypothetical protein T07_12835 [Trichinella nelsoni]|uniref:Uncharacterized protein n=1 Tax=Trichinella nelsoni TaxID=6336 RepID=A0A0V0SDB7_9BILA|nr:hypothetical protein T07_12835 [Trichinella nelsoni]